MSVVEAVERDLEAIRLRAPDLADSAIAASAKVLAAQLDNAGNSATSKSMCAKALLETMARLRELAPPVKKESDLDRVRARRAARRAGGAAT